eukprot:5955270-Prorocentrum_lima.AAC.1
MQGVSGRIRAWLGRNSLRHTQVARALGESKARMQRPARVAYGMLVSILDEKIREETATWTAP